MTIKNAVIYRCKIGKGTKIWNFCNLFDCEIGKNCVIGSFAEVGRTVKIGDNCTIGAHSFIPEGVTIGNNVFIAPHVCFTNDKYPHDTTRHEPVIKTTVEDDVVIGANATILCGITIGRNSVIGAGATVTKDVPENMTIVNTDKILKHRGKIKGLEKAIEMVGKLPESIESVRVYERLYAEIEKLRGERK